MSIFIFLVFTLWRGALFLIAKFAGKLFVFNPRFPYSEDFLVSSNLPGWIWSFANFDGVHYISIIKSGYSARFTQVFFPLYPLITRIISILLSNSYVLGGLIISNLSFFIALHIFAKLLKKDSLEKHAKWIMLFLVTFPFSFFFGSLYTESLFFLFVLASFLAARRKKWWIAGIFGALASATRITGIMLFPALLWEQYGSDIQRQMLGIKNIIMTNKKTKQRSKAILSVIKLLINLFTSPITYIAPMGLVSYMIYLQWKFNDFLYFWHVQPVFGAQRSGSSFVLPPQVLWRYAKILAAIPASKYDFWVALWELMSFVLVVLMLIIAHRKRIRLSYLIFSWLVILAPSLTGTFSSMPRYILVVFPIYMVLGQIENSLLRSIIIGAQILFLITFVSFFVQGSWVA